MTVPMRWGTRLTRQGSKEPGYLSLASVQSVLALQPVQIVVLRGRGESSRKRRGPQRCHGPFLQPDSGACPVLFHDLNDAAGLRLHKNDLAVPVDIFVAANFRNSGCPGF